MMEWAKESLAKVAATRANRFHSSGPKIEGEQAKKLLAQFHPDYLGKERTVAVGVHAGVEKFPLELAALLEADSELPESFTPNVDLETDVLILGGGGAGASAALALADSGLSVHLATKLRLGDSNTVMAEGGIQAALGEGDSTRRHFADSYVGGHGQNDTELLRILCESGPDCIRWLGDIGCLFDKNEDGSFRLRSGGGTSIPRVLACRDFTGLEIMRVLREAVRLTATALLEDHAALELTDDGEGCVTGAVLWDRAQRRLLTVSARAVLLATGGSGQLRLQGFPTSNHIGATGDGLILAYRQGCKIIHGGSHQYHPSGSAFPEALAGLLVTEAIRSTGAQVLNADAEHFINEVAYRDVLAAAILREVQAGRGLETPTGRKGVWLDTPLIEMKKGEGALRRQFPGIVHRFERYGIDPAKQPLLIYPTLHYQNGGIGIDSECRTERAGLWAAGEVTGGLHGSNRLMGNSLLDITVFGRRAAQAMARELPARKPVTLKGLKKYRAALKNFPEKSAAAITAPQLFPAAMNMKMDFSDAPSSAKSNGEDSPPTSEKSFEPPDPFSGR